MQNAIKEIPEAPPKMALQSDWKLWEGVEAVTNNISERLI